MVDTRAHNVNRIRHSPSVRDALPDGRFPPTRLLLRYPGVARCRNGCRNGRTRRLPSSVAVVGVASMFSSLYSCLCRLQVPALRVRPRIPPRYDSPPLDGNSDITPSDLISEPADFSPRRTDCCHAETGDRRDAGPPCEQTRRIASSAPIGYVAGDPPDTLSEYDCQG